MHNINLTANEHAHRQLNPNKTLHFNLKEKQNKIHLLVSQRILACGFTHTELHGCIHVHRNVFSSTDGVGFFEHLQAYTGAAAALATRRGSIGPTRMAPEPASANAAVRVVGGDIATGAATGAKYYSTPITSDTRGGSVALAPGNASKG